MRRRFALTILAVTTLVTLSFSIPFAIVIRTVAADQALIAADQESQSLAGVLSAAVTRAELQTVVDQLNAASARRATVILSDGDRIGVSVNIPSDDLALARSGRSFTASWDGFTHVLVPVRLAGGAVSIGIVGVPNAALLHGVVLAWTILGIVSFAIVLLGIVVADRLARSLVSSVQQLGAVTRRLHRGELSARVPLDGPPEIREVAETVNVLASRIVEMLDNERETAADLSHRLRTPLMALQLEADGLENERDRRRLTLATKALGDAVTSVISAARDGESRRAETVSSDFSLVVAERLEFWSVLAEDQGRRWESSLLGRPLLVQVDQAELSAAVDALLSNVFAHTEEGVAFRVGTEETDNGALLTIEDDGSGFPKNLVPTRGHSGIGSTGLGLDIVTQTAIRSKGTLELGRSPNGGAHVRVRFGSATTLSGAEEN